MWNSLESAITEMQGAAAELREVVSDHYIHDQEFVHVGLLSHVLFRIDELAGMLDTASLNLQDVLAEHPTPPSDLEPFGDEEEELDEFDWFEENDIDAHEILDRRMK